MFMKNEKCSRNLNGFENTNESRFCNN